ncbi:MAG: hypothetical protein HY592_06355 [Candidatus Omnitrophica bacterium]|nr:hypothetical protein [Candidatus Omnitrophota bacterium]
MEIEIQPNPNCSGCDLMVFAELEVPRPIRGIRIEERGREVDCEVTGIEEGGGVCQAFAVKVADSGAGYAYLVYGGAWGIRIQSSTHAWGEPYKLYGQSQDILYAHCN